MRRRVVITGIGTLSPLGLDVPTTWAGLLAGRSGIGPITKFDAAPYASRIAGEVRDFEPEKFIERKELRKMDTFIHYALAAAEEAVSDAAFKVDPDKADAVGVYIGSGIGGLPFIENTHAGLLARGPRRISPFFIPGLIINLASGQVSIRFGAKGPNLACATACATGNHAIGESMRLIRDGYCDAMISGGAEAVVTPLAVGGFAAMRALSLRNDEPERASRPFDADRDGFVVGEGAAILVLEEREYALARGARIYAEVAGYGMSGDAYHISAPTEDGDGAMRAMRMSLRDAGVDASEVDYVNAHATSTPVGDRIEVTAIKRVFESAGRLPVVSSTKSMTGHLLGAAGALETAVTALVLFHQVAPPTINVERQDPECDIDCVPNAARKLTARAAINNAFGFGGTNASLLLRRHEA